MFPAHGIRNGIDTDESAHIEPENPPFEPENRALWFKSRGGSRSQKIDRGFTSKSDPKIWPARQIKGGFSRSPAGRGGFLALYGLISRFWKFRTFWWFWPKSGFWLRPMLQNRFFWKNYDRNQKCKKYNFFIHSWSVENAWNKCPGTTLTQLQICFSKSRFWKFRIFWWFWPKSGFWLRPGLLILHDISIIKPRIQPKRGF